VRAAADRMIVDVSGGEVVEDALRSGGGVRADMEIGGGEYVVDRPDAAKIRRRQHDPVDGGIEVRQSDDRMGERNVEHDIGARRTDPAIAIEILVESSLEDLER